MHTDAYLFPCKMYFFYRFATQFCHKRLNPAISRVQGGFLVFVLEIKLHSYLVKVKKVSINTSIIPHILAL